jgi:hypothetical protein
MNIKLYGTLTPLLLSIQLNFKPYIFENASLEYIILYIPKTHSQIGSKIQLNGK